MAELNLKRHPDENWWDELRLTSVVFGVKAPHLKIYQKERYKTSGMSGDEWRFSWRHGIYVGDQGKEDWCNRADFAISAGVGMFATYPFLDTPDEERGVFKTPYRVVFYSRGQELASKEYTTLLEALLSLGKDEVLISERDTSIWDKRDRLQQRCCSQPGCTNKPISVYQIIKEYDDRGWELDERRCSRAPIYRHFCAEHLRRGDCGMEDNDDNYKIISGPGPDDSVVDPEKISESIQMFV